MRLRSVGVLGGGPGGLYTARLLKLRHPDCRVQLFEQSEPGSTFGFGVGLATRTQRNLEAADPDTFGDIVETAWAHEMSMAVGGRRVRLPADNLIAIGRSRLLDVLRTHAARAGVELHHGTRMVAEDLDAQLVIGADGVSSATREARAEEFGAQVDTHGSLYLWAGTDVALPAAVFAPVHTEHGTFVAHAYPYAADRSTFLIETDEETWRRAGFDLTTEHTPYDADDVASLDFLSDAFADHLEGHRLIGNRTRWLRFRTVTCRRWHAGNLVLLGDAVHTAHYSIGSGTKLAMEDGIALDRAIAEAADLTSAFQRFEEERRPAVAHLQETATRSMRWWDSFPSRLDLSVERLWVSYMTRAGKVPVERFAASSPDVVRTALAAYAGCSVDEVPSSELAPWILSRPLASPGRRFATRVLDAASAAGLLSVSVDLDDPLGAAADALVKDVAHGLADEGESAAVVVRCPEGTGRILTMFDVAERLRREASALVVAAVPSERLGLAADALAAGRIDLVVEEAPS